MKTQALLDRLSPFHLVVNRELAVSWGVLTHNLWMFARLKKTGKEDALRKAA